MKLKNEIDGAKVIKYTKNKDLGFVEFEDGEPKEINGLAICNYEQKEEYYLFACDDQFNVLGDTLHYTIEEAMKFAEEYYEHEKIEWINL